MDVKVNIEMGGCLQLTDFLYMPGQVCSGVGEGFGDDARSL